MTPQEDTAQRLLHAIMQFRRFHGKPQTIGGLTRGELIILVCVGEGAEANTIGLKVSEISNKLLIATPTATQQITALEAQGLVERRIDPVDRRVVRVQLTEKGAAITDEAKARLRGAFQGLVGYLGEEDSAQLAGLLERATTYFSTLREPGSPQAEEVQTLRKEAV
jgi:DNA-binding MarR family transcriptional regulator